MFFGGGQEEKNELAGSFALLERKISMNFNRNLEKEKNYNTVSQRVVPQVMNATPANPTPVFSVPKIFKIYDKHLNRPLTISIRGEEAKKLNMDWLLDTYMKQMMAVPGFDMASVACLKTKEDIPNFDYVLTIPEIALDVLPDYLELEPYYLESSRSLNLKNFKILRVVGSGGFSMVTLVRKRDTGQIFAMKIVKKETLLKKDKEEYIFGEKQILTQIDHPFLVQPT